MRWYNSLQTWLTVSFIIFILIASSITLFITYGQSRDALKQTVRESLTESVGIMSTQFSDEEIATLQALKAGDEGSPEYLAIVQHLQQMRSLSADVQNIYIVKKSGDDIVFIVDDIYGEDPEYAYIDEVYDDPDVELMNGFNAPTASPDFYTDEWGTFLSGYAPIRDKDGNVVAVLGADMTDARVKEKQDFLRSMVFVVIAACALISGLVIFLFSHLITRDIKRLQAVANRISEGNIDVQLPEITWKNEIYELNESMKGTLAAVQFLRDEAQKQEQAAKAEAKAGAKRK